MDSSPACHSTSRKVPSQCRRSTAHLHKPPSVRPSLHRQKVGEEGINHPCNTPCSWEYGETKKSQNVPGKPTHSQDRTCALLWPKTAQNKAQTRTTPPAVHSRRRHRQAPRHSCHAPLQHPTQQHPTPEAGGWARPIVARKQRWPGGNSATTEKGGGGAYLPFLPSLRRTTSFK